MDQNIKCLVIWECTIRKCQKKSDDADSLLLKIVAFINSVDMYAEL